MRLLSVTAVLCAAWLAPPARALEVQRLDVGYAKGRYWLEAVAAVEVSPPAVFAVLTDYAHLDLLDPTVLESRVVERPEPNVALVWMRVRGCVVFICKELEQVERVEEHAPEEILVELVPERSDLDYESARWQIEPTDGGSKLHYRLELEPGSWVPFFGRGSVQRQLRSSFGNALVAIEKLGRERESAP